MSGRSFATKLGLIVLVGLIGFSVAVAVLYFRDMDKIRAGVAGASNIVQTRHGPIEFTSWGTEPPVLVVHGASGGYDQGRLVPLTFGGDGYTWISVSRFGYLRSPMPDDRSTPAQAEAFADLLDELGHDRVAILAMSGGVPPSLQFAQRYPDRTTALVLLSSAPFTPLTANEHDLPIPAWLYQILFSSDFVFWSIVKLSPASLDMIFDVSPQARARLTESDREFVEGLIEVFLPVTSRTEGLRNEAAAVDPGTQYDLAKILAPTLVVHARDDGINPFPFGEYTANNIDGAQFMPLDTGGHLLLGDIEQVRARVMAFLAQNASALPQ